MSSKTPYIPPKYKGTKFHCIRCGVFSRQLWSFLEADGDRNLRGSMVPVPVLGVPSFRQDMEQDYSVSKCDHCENVTIWYKQEIIFPRAIQVENPNGDLADEIKALYNEAAIILNDSPRAAGALLRLALQHLLKGLGGRGKNINDDIKSVVASGVDAQVQKALDVIRVFGNNSTHPGEINLNEKPELVTKVFSLINFVAEKLISQHKEIDIIFDGLPASIKEQIRKRDAKK